MEDLFWGLIWDKVRDIDNARQHGFESHVVWII